LYEIAVCEEEATRLVNKLAELYNLARYNSADAPRVKQILDNLDLISKRADSLKEVLMSLDDLTIVGLRRIGTSGDKATHRLALTADADGLLPLHDRLLADSEPESTWTKRLGALSQLARETQADVVGVSGPDKGGNTNALTNIIGSPNEFLAREGLAVFDAFATCPGTGYEGGPFHSFISDTFEYAMGIEGESGASLIGPVKAAVRERNFRKQQREEELVLKSKIEALQASDPRCLSPEVQQQLASLRFRMKQLFHLPLFQALDGS
jgi:hypothetical protein